jgi:hypothetical protein
MGRDLLWDHVRWQEPVLEIADASSASTAAWSSTHRNGTIFSMARLLGFQRLDGDRLVPWQDSNLQPAVRTGSARTLCSIAKSLVERERQAIVVVSSTRAGGPRMGAVGRCPALAAFVLVTSPLRGRTLRWPAELLKPHGQGVGDA